MSSLDIHIFALNELFGIGDATTATSDCFYKGKGE